MNKTYQGCSLEILYMTVTCRALCRFGLLAYDMLFVVLSLWALWAHGGTLASRALRLALTPDACAHVCGYCWGTNTIMKYFKTNLAWGFTNTLESRFGSLIDVEVGGLREEVLEQGFAFRGAEEEEFGGMVIMLLETSDSKNYLHERARCKTESLVGR